MLDETRLHDSLDELAERPAPPFAVNTAAAIKQGRRLALRRRRLNQAGGTLAVGALAAVLAVTLIPAHGAGGRATAASSGFARTSAEASAPARPTGPGTDPLTLSGTFGWLPANAQNVGYSLHDSPTQVQAVARGAMNAQNPNTAMIWLTVYPKGTTPSLGSFADGATQLRVAAPEVDGRTAYWITDAANDPTNGGDTYLRWQSADGQWGELHGYNWGDDDVTATMLRVATGVDFAPHSVPVPMWISGLPSSAVTVEADLDRPDLTTGAAWDFYLAESVDGSTVEISVYPTAPAAGASAAHAAAGSVCTQQAGLTGCIAVTGNAAGTPAELIKHLTLLGPDPADWTTDVLVH
jgi:hypothetical protein